MKSANKARVNNSRLQSKGQLYLNKDVNKPNMSNEPKPAINLKSSVGPGLLGFGDTNEGPFYKKGVIKTVVGPSGEKHFVLKTTRTLQKIDLNDNTIISNYIKSFCSEPINLQASELKDEDNNKVISYQYPTMFSGGNEPCNRPSTSKEVEFLYCDEFDGVAAVVEVGLSIDNPTAEPGNQSKQPDLFAGGTSNAEEPCNLTDIESETMPRPTTPLICRPTNFKKQASNCGSSSIGLHNSEPTISYIESPSKGLANLKPKKSMTKRNISLNEKDISLSRISTDSLNVNHADCHHDEGMNKYFTYSIESKRNFDKSGELSVNKSISKTQKHKIMRTRSHSKIDHDDLNNHTSKCSNSSSPTINEHTGTCLNQGTVRPTELASLCEEETIKLSHENRTVNVHNCTSYEKVVVEKVPVNEIDLAIIGNTSTELKDEKPDALKLLTTKLPLHAKPHTSSDDSRMLFLNGDANNSLLPDKKISTPCFRKVDLVAPFDKKDICTLEMPLISKAHLSAEGKRFIDKNDSIKSVFESMSNTNTRLRNNLINTQNESKLEKTTESRTTCVGDKHDVLDIKCKSVTSSQGKNEEINTSTPIHNIEQNEKKIGVHSLQQLGVIRKIAHNIKSSTGEREIKLCNSVDVSKSPSAIPGRAGYTAAYETTCNIAGSKTKITTNSNMKASNVIHCSSNAVGGGSGKVKGGSKNGKRGTKQNMYSKSNEYVQKDTEIKIGKHSSTSNEIGLTAFVNNKTSHAKKKARKIDKHSELSDKTFHANSETCDQKKRWTTTGKVKNGPSISSSCRANQQFNISKSNKLNITANDRPSCLAPLSTETTFNSLDMLSAVASGQMHIEEFPQKSTAVEHCRKTYRRSNYFKGVNSVKIQKAEAVKKLDQYKYKEKKKICGDKIITWCTQYLKPRYCRSSTDIYHNGKSCDRRRNNVTLNFKNDNEIEEGLELEESGENSGVGRTTPLGLTQCGALNKMYNQKLLKLGQEKLNGNANIETSVKDLSVCSEETVMPETNVTMLKTIDNSKQSPPVVSNNSYNSQEIQSKNNDGSNQPSDLITKNSGLPSSKEMSNNVVILQRIVKPEEKLQRKFDKQEKAESCGNSARDCNTFESVSISDTKPFSANNDPNSSSVQENVCTETYLENQNSALTRDSHNSDLNEEQLSVNTTAEDEQLNCLTRVKEACCTNSPILNYDFVSNTSQNVVLRTDDSNNHVENDINEVNVSGKQHCLTKLHDSNIEEPYTNTSTADQCSSLPVGPTDENIFGRNATVFKTKPSCAPYTLSTQINPRVKKCSVVLEKLKGTIYSIPSNTLVRSALQYRNNNDSKSSAVSSIGRKKGSIRNCKLKSKEIHSGVKVMQTLKPMETKLKISKMLHSTINVGHSSRMKLGGNAQSTMKRSKSFGNLSAIKTKECRPIQKNEKEKNQVYQEKLPVREINEIYPVTISKMLYSTVNVGNSSRIKLSGNAQSTMKRSKSFGNLSAINTKGCIKKNEKENNHVYQEKLPVREINEIYPVKLLRSGSKSVSNLSDILKEPVQEKLQNNYMNPAILPNPYISLYKIMPCESTDTCCITEVALKEHRNVKSKVSKMGGDTPMQNQLYEDTPDLVSRTVRSKSFQGYMTKNITTGKNIQSSCTVRLPVSVKEDKIKLNGKCLEKRNNSLSKEDCSNSIENLTHIKNTSKRNQLTEKAECEECSSSGKKQNNRRSVWHDSSSKSKEVGILHRDKRTLSVEDLEGSSAITNNVSLEPYRRTRSRSFGSFMSFVSETFNETAKEQKKVITLSEKISTNSNIVKKMCNSGNRSSIDKGLFEEGNLCQKPNEDDSVVLPVSIVQLSRVGCEREMAPIKKHRGRPPKKRTVSLEPYRRTRSRSVGSFKSFVSEPFNETAKEQKKITTLSEKISSTNSNIVEQMCNSGNWSSIDKGLYEEGKLCHFNEDESVVLPVSVVRLSRVGCEREMPPIKKYRGRPPKKGPVSLEPYRQTHSRSVGSFKSFVSEPFNETAKEQKKITTLSEKISSTNSNIVEKMCNSRNRSSIDNGLFEEGKLYLKPNEVDSVVLPVSVVRLSRVGCEREMPSIKKHRGRPPKKGPVSLEPYRRTRSRSVGSFNSFVSETFNETAKEQKKITTLSEKISTNSNIVEKMCYSRNRSSIDNGLFEEGKLCPKPNEDDSVVLPVSIVQLSSVGCEREMPPIKKRRGRPPKKGPVSLEPYRRTRSRSVGSFKSFVSETFNETAKEQKKMITLSEKISTNSNIVEKMCNYGNRSSIDKGLFEEGNLCQKPNEDDSVVLPVSIVQLSRVGCEREMPPIKKHRGRPPKKRTVSLEPYRRTRSRSVGSFKSFVSETFNGTAKDQKKIATLSEKISTNSNIVKKMCNSGNRSSIDKGLFEEGKLCPKPNEDDSVVLPVSIVQLSSVGCEREMPPIKKRRGRLPKKRTVPGSKCLNASEILTQNDQFGERCGGNSELSISNMHRKRACYETESPLVKKPRGNPLKIKTPAKINQEGISSLLIQNDTNLDDLNIAENSGNHHGMTTLQLENECCELMDLSTSKSKVNDNMTCCEIASRDPNFVQADFKMKLRRNSSTNPPEKMKLATKISSRLVETLCQHKPVENGGGHLQPYNEELNTSNNSKKIIPGVYSQDISLDEEIVLNFTMPNIINEAIDDKNPVPLQELKSAEIHTPMISLYYQIQSTISNSENQSVDPQGDQPALTGIPVENKIDLPLRNSNCQLSFNSPGEHSNKVQKLINQLKSTPRSNKICVVQHNDQNQDSKPTNMCEVTNSLTSLKNSISSTSNSTCSSSHKIEGHDYSQSECSVVIKSVNSCNSLLNKSNYTSMSSNPLKRRDMSSLVGVKSQIMQSGNSEPVVCGSRTLLPSQIVHEETSKRTISRGELSSPCANNNMSVNHELKEESVLNPNISGQFQKQLCVRVKRMCCALQHDNSVTGVVSSLSPDDGNILPYSLVEALSGEHCDEGKKKKLS